MSTSESTQHTPTDSVQQTGIHVPSKLVDTNDDGGDETKSCTYSSKCDERNATQEIAVDNDTLPNNTLSTSQTAQNICTNNLQSNESETQNITDAQTNSQSNESETQNIAQTNSQSNESETQNIAQTNSQSNESETQNIAQTNSQSNESETQNIAQTNSQSNESERYLKILCRLYPHQSQRILQLILKGCNNDVVEAIESILSSRVQARSEWTPIGLQCCMPHECNQGYTHNYRYPCDHACIHNNNLNRGTHNVHDCKCNDCLDIKTIHTIPNQTISSTQTSISLPSTHIPRNYNPMRSCYGSPHLLMYPHCYQL